MTIKIANLHTMRASLIRFFSLCFRLFIFFINNYRHATINNDNCAHIKYTKLSKFKLVIKTTFYTENLHVYKSFRKKCDSHWHTEIFFHKHKCLVWFINFDEAFPDFQCAAGCRYKLACYQIKKQCCGLKSHTCTHLRFVF